VSEFNARDEFPRAPLAYGMPSLRPKGEPYPQLGGVPGSRLRHLLARRIDPNSRPPIWQEKGKLRRTMDSAIGARELPMIQRSDFSPGAGI